MESEEGKGREGLISSERGSRAWGHLLLRLVSKHKIMCLPLNLCWYEDTEVLEREKGEFIQKTLKMMGEP